LGPNFIYFHNKRHPRSMGNSEVEAFLEHTVLKRNMSAKTQAANGVVSPFSRLWAPLLILYRYIFAFKPISLSIATLNNTQKSPV